MDYEEELTDAINRLENAPVLVTNPDSYRDDAYHRVSKDVQTVLEAAGRYLDLM